MREAVTDYAKMYDVFIDKPMTQEQIRWLKRHTCRDCVWLRLPSASLNHLPIRFDEIGWCTEAEEFVLTDENLYDSECGCFEERADA